MKSVVISLLLTAGYAQESCQKSTEPVSMIQLNRMRDSTDSIERIFDDLVENPSDVISAISRLNEDKQAALLQRAAEPNQWKQLVTKFENLPDASKINLIKHGEISPEMGDMFNALPEAYQTHTLQLIQDFDADKASELEQVISSKGGSKSNSGSVDASVFGKGGAKKTTKKTTTTTTTPSAQADLVSKVTQDNKVATDILKSFKSASDIAAKLEVLQRSVEQAGWATRKADEAIQSFSSKLVSISNDISTNKQEALWDGTWNEKDLEVFVTQGIDIFLKIVKTFLIMTVDLGTLANALDAVLTILKQIVELAVSVTKLIQAVGTSNIDTIQSLSTRATAVINTCSDEVAKITKAEKGLKPILEKWENADTLGRATVVAVNLPGLKQGFEDLGEAWKSVQTFVENTVKPLEKDMRHAIYNLGVKLKGYQLPVNPPVNIPVPSIPWPKVATGLLR